MGYGTATLNTYDSGGIVTYLGKPSGLGLWFIPTAALMLFPPELQGFCRRGL